MIVDNRVAEAIARCKMGTSLFSVLASRYFMLKPFYTVLLAVTLTACITPSIRDWPEQVPRQALFERAYRADAANQQVQSRQEYLEWILGFYQGTVIYPTGWLDVEEQLLQRTPAEQQAQLDERLEELGIVIGAEWAKENDARLIDNRMLALWGSTLQLMEDAEQRLEAIEVVARDIDQLFEGELQKEDITEQRYADRLGFEAFGGF